MKIDRSEGVFEFYMSSTYTCICINFGGPPRGFGDSGRRAIYFQGFEEKGHLFSGILGDFGVLGSRGLRKNTLGSWGERSFFFQGAKTPPLGGLISVSNVLSNTRVAHNGSM